MTHLQCLSGQVYTMVQVTSDMSTTFRFISCFVNKDEDNRGRHHKPVQIAGFMLSCSIIKRRNFKSTAYLQAYVNVMRS